MSSTVANGTSRAGIDAAAASLMVLLTLSWGLNYVAAKVSYAGYDPVFLSVLRAVIGGFFVLLWCWWRGIRLFSRDGTLAAGALVCALFGLEFLCLYIGLELTTVARNTLMVNSIPFWMLLGCPFRMSEPFITLQCMRVLLAFAGAILVFINQSSMEKEGMLFGSI